MYHGSCISKAEIPQGKGIHISSNNILPCSVPECLDCHQNHASCSKCDNGKAVDPTPISASCVEVSALKPGRGLDLTSGFVTNCTEKNCLDCRDNSQKCKLCNTEEGYYLRDSFCVHVSNIAQREGLKEKKYISTCAYLHCLNCSANYFSCSELTNTADEVLFKQSTYLLLERLLVLTFDQDIAIVNQNTKYITNCLSFTLIPSQGDGKMEGECCEAVKDQSQCNLTVSGNKLLMKFGTAWNIYKGSLVLKSDTSPGIIAGQQKPTQRFQGKIEIPNIRILHHNDGTKLLSSLITWVFRTWNSWVWLLVALIFPVPGSCLLDLTLNLAVFLLRMSCSTFGMSCLILETVPAEVLDPFRLAWKNYIQPEATAGPTSQAAPLTTLQDLAITFGILVILSLLFIPSRKLTDPKFGASTRWVCLTLQMKVFFNLLHFSTSVAFRIKYLIENKEEPNLSEVVVLALFALWMIHVLWKTAKMTNPENRGAPNIYAMCLSKFTAEGAAIGHAQLRLQAERKLVFCWMSLQIIFAILLLVPSSISFILPPAILLGLLGFQLLTSLRWRSVCSMLFRRSLTYLVLFTACTAKLLELVSAVSDLDYAVKFMDYLLAVFVVIQLFLSGLSALTSLGGITRKLQTNAKQSRA